MATGCATCRFTARCARSRTWCRRYDVEEVIIAMPRATGAVVRQVVKAAMEAGVQTRTVPGIFDIISGRVAVASLREVEIQDLLRREPIQTDLEQVRVLATGETVLVTGAGGSIGSELCRQLARLEPAQLLVLGHGENSIFDVMAELTERYPQRRARCRSSPTSATGTGCGRSSSATGRTPCSTRRPTSTCR